MGKRQKEPQVLQLCLAGDWRESTPTAPQGRSLGECFDLEVGPEADSGKPHPSESLTPREWVSVCATQETSYNSYLLFPILLRLPPQTPLLLPFFLYFSPLPLPWTFARSTASSPALPWQATAGSRSHNASHSVPPGSGSRHSRSDLQVTQHPEAAAPTACKAAFLPPSFVPLLMQKASFRPKPGSSLNTPINAPKSHWLDILSLSSTLFPFVNVTPKPTGRWITTIGKNHSLCVIGSRGQPIIDDIRPPPTLSSSREAWSMRGALLSSFSVFPQLSPASFPITLFSRFLHCIRPLTGDAWGQRMGASNTPERYLMLVAKQTIIIWKHS